MQRTITLLSTIAALLVGSVAANAVEETRWGQLKQEIAQNQTQPSAKVAANKWGIVSIDAKLADLLEDGPKIQVEPVVPDWLKCQQDCEAAFAQQAAQVQAMYVRATLLGIRYGTGDPRYLEVYLSAIEAENQAVARLIQCLEECPPNPLRFLAEPIADIVERLIEKYLGT